MNNDDASVEQYRQRWEADDHWAMRRDFILRHRGAFSENRLLCLAQTFVNIELLGCRYPTEVVNLVQELAKDLKKSERPSLPKFARVAFVKAEDAVADDASLCDTSESKVTDSVANLLEDGSGQLNLETFVLFENHNASLDAASILHNSASANRLKCTFETSADESSFRCTVVLGQCEIGVALGTSKQEAKEAAATTSLNYLRGLVPTLRMKRLVDGCGPEVTKNRVGTSQAVQERISTENVGHRLLTMMGWTGGGVGKEGAGIVEPVMLKETSHRNGLGYAAPPGAKMSPGFKAKVVEVLREFSRTVVLQDLVFSPEFDNEERKYIHTVAHRFGLKSISRGGQEKRFITVRHKLSARELVEEILRTGSTDKYEVVLPGQ
ncbi:Nkrf protein, putative [Ixodes scapularis]|uniref:Nkrf protein, putative n=1 Tax=Ixodes scapularis TaxID=6945 RepID=B7P6C5_IXOSC|nr:Nkrf protein, putative [Ixodes scapularis]|eukprot:XP_002408520.1 Nkrf protein, putative [Ixodes scapularis]